MHLKKKFSHSVPWWNKVIETWERLTIKTMETIKVMGNETVLINCKKFI
jgi:hypothetical protein